MRSAQIALGALLVSLAIAVTTKLFLPFDGLYGQDAFSYFRYGAALWPHLRTGTPLPDFYWPIGYPATLALLLPFTGEGPVAGQIVSALACAVAAAATCLIVGQLRGGPPLRGRSAEVVAGLVTALSGASLRYSEVVMADGLALGATAAALLFVIHYAQTRRGPWLIACAVAVAWGAASRWLVCLLVLPIGAFLTLHAREARQRLSSDPIERNRSSASDRRWVVFAALVGLAIFLPVLVLAHASPASPEKHGWLVGWRPKNALGRDFHTPDGHAVYRLPPALFYLARLAWPDYFFPLLIPLVLAGAWMLLRERRLADAALLVGWPATIWLFLSGIPYENPRFLLPTLPAIGSLVGLGFSDLSASLGVRSRLVLSAMIAVSLVAGLKFGIREHARLVARKNDDRDLVSWLSGRLPPNASLLVGGPTLVLEQYGSFATHELYLAKEPEIGTLIATGQPLFVLADVDVLKSQWAGLLPEQTFERLRANPGLTAVDVHPPYTLFQAKKLDPKRSGGDDERSGQ